MLRKNRVVVVICWVLLFGAGTTFGLEDGNGAGPASMEISSTVDGADGTSGAGTREVEMEDEDEPILTIEEDPWAILKSAAAVVGILFGSGIGPTAS